MEEFEGDWGHSRLPWIPDCVGMTRAGEMWTAMAGFDGRLADRPRLGTSPSATFFLQPSAVVVWATVVGVAGRWRNRSRLGVRDMLSYQSLIPAVAGTPRYENWVHWLKEGFRCRPSSPTPPLAGDKPQRYISPSTLGGRCLGDGGWCRRSGGGIDPGSESGTCFRTNRLCWPPPAHSRYENGAALVGGSVLGVIGATPGFRLSPETPMALRRPHKGMKIGDAS